MSNSDEWEHVGTRPCGLGSQIFGSSESVYVFENKRTGKRREVVAYDLDHAGIKIANGEFSDWKPKQQHQTLFHYG